MHGTALNSKTTAHPPSKSFPPPLPLRTSFQNTSIYIRPFHDADSVPLFAAARESINELCAWMTWCTPNYCFQDSQSFVARSQVDWAKGHNYCFAILDVKDDTFLGSVGLSHINHAHKVANMGIWVRSSRTREGVAPAAILLIAAFAFQELHLSRMEILVASNNQPSIRMAHKVGAKVEGVLRNKLNLSGKRHDAVMCSLIPEDLQGPPQLSI